MKRQRLDISVGRILIILIVVVLLLPACAKAPTPGAQAPTVTVTKPAPTVTETAKPAPAPTVTVTAQPAPAPTVTVTATAAPAQVFNWKQACMGTATSPWFVLEKPFAEAVEKMSGGRLKIEVHPQGDFFPVTETIANVKNGAVQIGSASGDYSKGLDKRFANTSYLPGSPCESPATFEIMVWATDYKDVITALYKEYNCQWIGTRYGPPEQMLSTMPIRTIAEFQGKKLRGSGPSELLFKALGASPTYIDFGELYNAIKLGTVVGGDATTAKGNWDNGFHEVTKYIIDPMLYTRGFTMDHYVNMDAWKSLPADLQQILITACRANGTAAWTAERAVDLEYQQKMIDYGLKLIILPSDDVIKAFQLCQGIWNELAKADPMSAKRVECERKAAKLLSVPGF